MVFGVPNVQITYNDLIITALIVYSHHYRSKKIESSLNILFIEIEKI